MSRLKFFEALARAFDIFPSPKVLTAEEAIAEDEAAIRSDWAAVEKDLAEAMPKHPKCYYPACGCPFVQGKVKCQHIEGEVVDKDL